MSLLLLFQPNTGTGSVLTKTQAATARVATNRTATQPATARIAKAGLVKTQPAISRISNTRTVTQPAIARVAKAVTVTQSATARIANAGVVKTQPAIARVATNRSFTQGATGRIAINKTITQLAISRISNTRIVTQPATARVARTIIKTQTATARIANAGVVKTQSSVARIAVNRSLTQTAIARVAINRIVTQPAIARVARTVTKTQTATANIAVTLVEGAIFRDNGTSANYTNTGANTTYGGNNGMFGTLGANTSMHINYSGAAFVFEGAEKTLANAATIFQFFYRTASAATLNTGNTIFTVWTSASYTSSTAPIRLDLTMLTTNTYKFSLIDPSNSFTTTSGTATFTRGTATRLVLVQTTAGWKLYINNSTTADITYAHTQTTIGYSNVTFGTHYQNAATSYVGIADVGEVWIGNPLNTAPTTVAGKLADAYNGYLQNHLALSGQPYRNADDGSNLSGTSGFIDTVSEGVAYMLKLNVQNNDQASFKLVDNWVLGNLLRSNSTVGNTNNNPAPANALNLMAFKYNSANTDGKGIGSIYDANWAGDADPERAQALLWAHSRWGSSALTVGIAGELVAPNYLQRALNVLADLRTYALRLSSSTGFYYLVNDSFQTSDPVQMAPDYNNPAAFKLFAQYDSGNASTWNGAVSGSYDILTKTAAQVMTGATPTQTSTSSLNADWIQFTLSTGLTSATLSTYGDSDYGFNAFRTANRLYDAYSWYNDTSALTALRLPKTFWTNEWTVNSKIRATFKHDGTNTGSYEISMFTYAAYWSIYAADISNVTATAINTNKLSNLYYQEPYGSIISDSYNSAAYGYFGQSWAIINYMQQNGLWLNYGQVSVITKLQPAIARIAKVITKTQPAIARVAKTTIKTQTATANITILTAFAKTQTATARIVTSRSFTQTATARIAQSLTKTQPAIARISITRTVTQPAVARVARILTKIQLATARIITNTNVAKTQPATARIATTRSLTQTATARITQTYTKVQIATARIAQTLTVTRPAVARIVQTFTVTQSATARLAKTVTKTQSATARIIIPPVIENVTNLQFIAHSAVTVPFVSPVSNTITGKLPAVTTVLFTSPPASTLQFIVPQRVSVPFVSPVASTVSATVTTNTLSVTS
jgi:hypothetical protein